MGRWIPTLIAYRHEKRWALFSVQQGKFVQFGGRKAMKTLESGYWSMK